MNEENPFTVIGFMVIGLVFGFALVSMAIHPQVGITYRGVVVQEICNGGNLDSYILIQVENQTSQTRSYRIGEYRVCLDFLYHHGKGVIITDDAWFNRIAYYRWIE